MVESGLRGVLREIRNRYGLSQLDLSEAVGTSRSTVSRWERDEGSPSPSNLDRLAEQFPYYRSILYVAARRLPSELKGRKRHELLKALDFE